jgi:hypothetical protein
MGEHDGARQVPELRVKVIAETRGSSSWSSVGWCGAGEALLLSLGVSGEELEAS